MIASSALGRIMALDVGSRTIGIAFSDETRTVALPHSVMERQSEGYRRDVAEIRRLADEMGACLIVVGLPLTLEGERGRAAAGVERFAEALRRRVAVEVVMQDERLTTFEAEEALMEARLRRAERKRHVDAVAASLILRAYLDESQALAP